MRGIVIDPRTRTVEARDIPAEGLAAIRAAIGPVYVDRVRLAPGVDLWIDDEGFLTAQETQAYFGLVRADWSVQAIAGRAVIFGIDPQGETTPCPDAILPELVRRWIVWLGDAWELDAAMSQGVVDRPENWIENLSTGERTISWRWEPPPRPAA